MAQQDTGGGGAKTVTAADKHNQFSQNGQNVVNRVNAADNTMDSGTDLLIKALTDAYQQSLSGSSSSDYISQMQLNLQQQQFDFSKSQWADQLSQWDQQFGFSKSSFDQNLEMQWAQLNGSQDQFNQTLDLQKQQAQHSWDQFLSTFDENKSEFGQQLGQQKSQFDATMQWNKDSLDKNLGYQYDALKAGLQDNADARSQAHDEFLKNLSAQQSMQASDNNTKMAIAGMQSSDQRYSAQLNATVQRERNQIDLTLGQGQLDVSRGQLAVSQKAEAFNEKDVNTQRLLEAAGLATSPEGAIQLAYMARGAGAPAGAIAAMFQNLPFVQAALKGDILPGFTGLPTQLGGGASGDQATPAAGGTVTTSASGGAQQAAAVGSGATGQSTSSAGGAAASSAPQSREMVKITRPNGTVSIVTPDAARMATKPAGTKVERITQPVPLQGASLNQSKKAKHTGGADGHGGNGAPADAMAAAVSQDAGAGSSGVNTGPGPGGQTIDFKRGLGVQMPDLTSYTEQGFNNLSDNEKLFVGALYQSEKGIPAAQALSQITKSFIPTMHASALSVL